MVFVCIGIAALGEEHIGVLARLAEVLVVPEQAARLRSAERTEDVLAILQSPLEEASQ
jgi:mannitol/fructose-specific phosphotransferase system IIA component